MIIFWLFWTIVFVLIISVWAIMYIKIHLCQIVYQDILFPEITQLTTEEKDIISSSLIRCFKHDTRRYYKNRQSQIFIEIASLNSHSPLPNRIDDLPHLFAFTINKFGRYNHYLREMFYNMGQNEQISHKLRFMFKQLYIYCIEDNYLYKGVVSAPFKWRIKKFKYLYL